MLVNQPAILSGAFAAEGDKNVIPANNDGLSGLASIAKGFPPITQVPLAQGGLPPQRQDFNGIFNLFSQFLLYAQNGGVYEYNNTLDYQPPCIISYDGEFYSCLQENGPSTSAGVQAPTITTYWEKLVPDVAVMTGASGSAAGTAGLVPAPQIGEQNKALFGDGTFKTVLNSVNGITPTNGDVDINRKFYNSLAQLGLNYNTVTFEQIVNTLPVNSTLTFYVDIVTSQPTYAPNLDIPVSGFIVVTKGASNTVPIKFTLSPIDNVTTYLGEYTTYNSYGFKGWQPIVLSVNGAKPNYTGNVTVTVPVDTYAPWKWSGGGITIDGYTVTFTNGFKMAIWYMLFPNQTNQLTVNFLTPFTAPPCVFGSIVVKNSAIHLIPNVFNVTATSVTCVTNNTASETATYWVAMGYDS